MVRNCSSSSMAHLSFHEVQDRTLSCPRPSKVPGSLSLPLLSSRLDESPREIDATSCSRARRQHSQLQDRHLDSTRKIPTTRPRFHNSPTLSSYLQESVGNMSLSTVLVLERKQHVIQGHWKCRKPGLFCHLGLKWCAVLVHSKSGVEAPRKHHLECLSGKDWARRA
jgi:hypothetical protein